MHSSWWFIKGENYSILPEDNPDLYRESGYLSSHEIDAFKNMAKNIVVSEATPHQNVSEVLCYEWVVKKQVEN